jgi:phosphatidylinositol alpha-1,6-mannosyltransferase
MDDRPQKLLLVTRNFPPIKGGMERLNQFVLSELSIKFQTFLVGPTGAGRFSPKSTIVRECSPRLAWFLPVSLLLSARIALKNKQDIVLAGSGLSAVSAWAAALISKCRWGVYLHGLDIVVDSVIYQNLIFPFIRRANFLIVNSRATQDAAIAAGLDPKRIHLVHPGVNIPDQCIDPQIAEGWCRSHDIVPQQFMISVGRLTQRKGLVEFVLNSLPSIVDRFPEACLVVVGEEPRNSATSCNGYTNRLLEAARSSGVLDNLKLLGSITDEELTWAFAAAKLHVFPVLDQKGDMEGFGMVAIEAASFGVPTIAFSVGGVVDAVLCDVSGDLIEPGDYQAMDNAIIEVLNGERNYDREAIRNFADDFSWPRFGTKLRAIEALRDDSGTIS